ncbi:MAG: GspE/PulE family protein [Defluviitaleaceae bacterium]|nr:GspE/PulE family protein [Defluviitaleaceae bacterium]MCL2263834.1 GspE/PulE family protein [Defluviitaleaceae bacterium]
MQSTPFVRLAEIEIDTDASRLLGYNYAVRYMALPVSCTGEFLRVALRDAEDMAVISHLADITGKFILPLAAEESDLKVYINKVFAGEEVEQLESEFKSQNQLKDSKTDMEGDSELSADIPFAPVVRLVNSLVESAVLKRASDIHIEPFGKKLRARFRIDGELITYKQVDISMQANVISRLKIMSGMDISEKRVPQDGAFSMKTGGKKIDFRLSTLPTTDGEKMVIRLLYDKKTRIKKDELGFFEDDLTRLTQLFARPFGAIIMTGPTGSGKSTTLKCFLEELNAETKNIITVEDPVENPILGISHINVERHTLTFADALRHILRQDPDIIMIGEIRDEETARIAISAAITGHVVLTTLHTNDAAGVIERLSDMGIEPYFAAAALNGVISQRLVRRICRECSAPTTISAHAARVLGVPPDTPVRHGTGCAHCNFTGFHSRFAIYEYITMHEETRRQMIANPAEFAATIRKRDNLRKNAIRSLKAGFTTAEEIIRVLNRDDENEE